MPYLVGIDLGTSGARAVIVDADGKLKGKGRSEFPIDTPHANWAEQDPAVWVESTVKAIQQAVKDAEASPYKIAGVGLSGQMHSTVCLDAEGQVIRPAIIWPDQRSKRQVQEVYQRIGKRKLGAWTANPLATGFTLANLLWLRENELHNYERTRHVLLAKDYLRYHFTGEIGTDVTDASGTSLMDVARRTWSTGLLNALGLEGSILPSIHQSSEVAGYLKREVAVATGLAEGLPVVYGGGDQAMQAVGNGVIRPGLMSSTIGTGGQLFVPVESPIYDSELRLHTFCHAVPDYWHLMAATLSAGLSLSWLREKLLGSAPYASLLNAAAEVSPGADGVLFLPYLVGERTPHMDPTAKGAFIGLTLRHGRAHLTRAVMEGAVLALREGLELLLELGGSVERVLASGGGTRHPLWLQLQADIFNRDIYQAKTEEAAAFGAALVAGVGVGIYKDFAEACARAVRWKDTVVKPNPENVACYEEIFRRYQRLYPALRDQF